MAKKKAGSRRMPTKKKSTKKTPVKQTARKQSAPKKPAKKKSGRSDPSSVERIEDELQALLERADSQEQLIRLLAPLGETQRKAVAPICLAWLRKQKKDWTPLRRTAELAVFCVGGLTDIRRLGRRSFPVDDHLIEILTLRKPEWVDQIAEMLLDDSRYWRSWRTVRELVNRKLCPKPSNPRYYTGMITGLSGARSERGRKDAITALRDDPALLKDEVWRLFEFEGDGQNTLNRVDRWIATSWSGALATLSKEGKLSRARLLASSLGALELGFNHYRARWFFKFFDLLDPNDRELRKHADTILDLMGSPTPNVAAWAFARVEQLLDRGLVKDASRLADAVSPLLMAKQKGTVQKALKLFGQLVESSPKSATDICRAATEALGHEKVEIQKAAFALIAKHSTTGDQQLCDAVQKYLPVVAASFRPQLTEWLEPAETTSGGDTPAKRKQSKKKPANKAPAQKSGDAASFDRRRLKAYPDSDVALMKIDELVATLESGSNDSTVTIPAATFNGTEIPRLDPDRRLTQISSLEELIDVCGRVLENSALIDDGERAIDGLSRLASNKPDDFAELIGPLLKRATTFIKKRDKVPFTGESISSDLCGLICAWVSPQPITVRHTEERSLESVRQARCGSPPREHARRRVTTRRCQRHLRSSARTADTHHNFACVITRHDSARKHVTKLPSIRSLRTQTNRTQWFPRNWFIRTRWTMASASGISVLSQVQSTGSRLCGFCTANRSSQLAASAL